MKKDEVVTLQELVVTNMLELDALVQLLVRKGIINEAELLNEIREMKYRLLAGGKQGSA